MATVVVDLGNWASKARLRCPYGHTWWELREGGFYCHSCREQGREASLERLIDAKTGRWVERDDVEVR